MTLRKSITKRIRVTKTGKAVRRKMGVSHFRTRNTNSNLRSKTKSKKVGLDYPLSKIY